MVEYAMVLSNSIRNLWYGFNQNPILLAGIAIALAVVLVLVLKPPKA